MNASEELKTATERRDTAAAKVAELREEETRLIDLIDKAAASAKVGKADGTALTTLATECGSIRQQLREAETELSRAESSLQRETIVAQRTRFDALCIAAAEERDEVIRCFQECSLHLGAFCQMTGELAELTAILGKDLSVQLPTRHAAQMASSLPDPLRDWLGPDSEFEVWRGWNFQLSFSVSPIVRKLAQEKK